MMEAHSRQASVKEYRDKARLVLANNAMLSFFAGAYSMSIFFTFFLSPAFIFEPHKLESSQVHGTLSHEVMRSCPNTLLV